MKLINLQIFVFLLLSSCSTTSLSLGDKPLFALNDSFSKVCLNSKGKGRITLGKRKVVFSFESVFDKKSQTKKNVDRYFLAITPPFQRPYIISFYYKDNDKILVRGSFWRMLKERVPKNSLNYKLAESLIIRLAEVIKISSMNFTDRERTLLDCEVNPDSKNGFQGFCPFKEGFQFDLTKKSKTLTFQYKNQATAKVILERPSETHFEKFTLEGSFKGKTLIRLEMFLSGCASG